VAVEPSTVRTVVRTVGRISDILNCFSREQPVLSLTAISARVGLPKSTAYAREDSARPGSHKRCLIR
jgi:IclR helix-turn-helix domain